MNCTDRYVRYSITLHHRGALYAGPLFAVVQKNVVGKGVPELREPFLSRTFDAAKVFSKLLLSLPY